MGNNGKAPITGHRLSITGNSIYVRISTIIKTSHNRWCQAMKDETPIRNTATYLLAISLFCLAGALLFFTIKISHFTDTIPGMMEGFENTSAMLEPVRKNVHEISTLIPVILEETKQVRELIPSILDESREVRGTIPPALDEIRKTRQLVPQILQETALLRQQLASIVQEIQSEREQIPDVLKTVDKTCDTIDSAIDELRLTRELIPPVLEEIRKTRESIPSMLQKAEHITTKARTTGQQASEGAMTGIVTGIAKAPFKIIGDIGKSLVVVLDVDEEGISDEDRAIINKLMRPLLVSGSIGDSHAWANEKNDHKGTVTLTDIVTIDDNLCKMLHIETTLDDEILVQKNITACMNNHSEWEALDKSSFQQDF